MENELTLEEFLWIELKSSWHQIIIESFYQDAE
jgi:hypothetical protein